MTKAVIMAGGLGTRLSSVTKDTPKPMVKIAGRPLLEYQIENLKKFNIRDICIVVGYMSDVIIDYFGDGSEWDVSITYYTEDTPLGTAGALPRIYDSLEGEFLLIMGDLFTAVDYERFMEAHKQSGADISILVHPNSHPYDSDLIVRGADGRVRDWISKHSEHGDSYENLVNAGIYIIKKKLILSLGTDGKRDLDKELILPATKEGKTYAYRSTEYVKDIGTPDRLKAVEAELSKGIPEQRRLDHPQKCIFFDRDGTLNVYKGFLRKKEEMELEISVADAVRMINSSEYLAVVVTNQPVIARGEVTYEGLKEINNRMETLLGEEGAYIDRIYFCPHHPDRGFAGEIKELKVKCDCRKPAVGLLLKAKDELHIDLSKSWIVGDTTTDIQTGVNAGMMTALVLTGEGGRDGKYHVKPDITGNDLREIVEKILKAETDDGTEDKGIL